ncbi:hypothetical protein Taro_029912 [Colocasia esculenta]|uniref:Uncharacterized protein n=1 Tax=Colocasia esculenta TaxID=4460 RepID=A0A843VUM4_COLES|nr:hypothetical protein [Colocasia esculenta]
MSESRPPKPPRLALGLTCIYGPRAQIEVAAGLADTFNNVAAIPDAILKAVCLAWLTDLSGCRSVTWGRILIAVSAAVTLRFVTQRPTPSHFGGPEAKSLGRFPPFRLSLLSPFPPFSEVERSPSHPSPALELGGAAGDSCVERQHGEERGGGGRGVVKALHGVVLLLLLLEFLLLWLVRDWLSLLSLVHKAHPPYSLQAPDCCFRNLFLGAVNGGTGECVSLTSWCVRGAECFRLWVLDLLEVKGSSACGETSFSSGCSVSLVVTPVCAFLTSWRSRMAVLLS